MVDDIVVVRACNVGGGRTHSAPGFGKGICGKSLHVEHLFMAAQWTITLVRGWSVGQVVLTRRCIPKEKTDASKERCGRCRGLQASRTCALSELESELLCALAEVTELCHRKKKGNSFGSFGNKLVEMRLLFDAWQTSIGFYGANHITQ